MRTLRFLTVGAIALSVLWACSDDEDELTPEPVPEPEPVEEYDEAYYADQATISSEDAHFTATEEGGEIEYKVEGGEVVVTVDCGVEWTATVEYLDAEEDWLDAAVDCEAGTLTVTAEANTVEAEKTATVTVMTAESGIEFATISVSQNAYGACEITAETNEWNAPAVGELTTEIAVEATADWEITNTAEWLTAEKTDTGVKFTASENEETEERTAEIVLTCTDGISTDSETITVTQDAKAYITVGLESVYFGADEGSQSVDVDSNFDWISSTDETWLTVTGSGSTLTVSVSANESGADREGTVTVTASDGAENKAEATFTVTQSYLSAKAFVLEYTMTADSQEAMLPLNGTVDCTVNWGDGSDPEAFPTTLPTHTYATAGDYEIQ
ncbi:MAG: BACON domain-containing protein, partial [Bacteroidales bacterium]|nr:BACON domain-containing protein [Bacteroidales bacterium]